MEITWYGLSCFRMAERGLASVVTDPYPDEYGYILPRSRAHIVTVSGRDPARNAIKTPRGPFRILDGPGEYEIKGVFVIGVALVGARDRGTMSTRNIIFVFEYGGLTVCHLGGMNHVPSRSQIEALGTIDVLLTPVGGADLISAAQAAEVISMLEPRLVIPMHYHTPRCKVKLPRANTFLKEMGVDNVESAEVLQVSRSTLPQETQVLLLSPRQ